MGLVIVLDSVQPAPRFQSFWVKMT